MSVGRERNPTQHQIFFYWLELLPISLYITLPSTAMNTIAKTPNITFGNISFNFYYTYIISKILQRSNQNQNFFYSV